MDFIAKWKEFTNRMNQYGIPIPVVRDPKTGLGSITATLLVISANVVIIALLNSFANIFKGVDIANALTFFGICFMGYLGRNFQTKGLTAGGEEKKTENKE